MSSVEATQQRRTGRLRRRRGHGPPRCPETAPAREKRSGHRSDWFDAPPHGVEGLGR